MVSHTRFSSTNSGPGRAYTLQHANVPVLSASETDVERQRDIVSASLIQLNQLTDRIYTKLCRSIQLRESLDEYLLFSLIQLLSACRTVIFFLFIF